MASGLSMPVGIKNDTHGDISVAINGVLFARGPQSFIGANDGGMNVVVSTSGNRYAHIILRGGDDGPNYDAESVREAQAMLEEAGLEPVVVVDSSHANSNKDHNQQPIVFEDVIKQIKDGNKGIVGIMLESNLEPGNQSIPTDLSEFDPSTLEYGLSVTDACVGWEDTERIILDAYRALSTKSVLVP